MDAFKDLFQEIKDRVRNPFFSSFAIAWLFFNWQITVALLFFDNEILKQSGYRTYNDLIDAKQDNLKMLLYPVLSACFYVFVFPYLRNFINQFLASRKMENENKILENSKKSSVKLERYIDLLRELEEQQKMVGEIYSEQKKDLEKMATLQTDLSKEKKANNELRQQCNEADQVHQSYKNNTIYPNVLGGKWRATFNEGEETKTESWVISGDDIYAHEEKEMKIREYLYNPATNQVHFTLVVEIKEPQGNGVFFVHEQEQDSYLLKYSAEEQLYRDIKKDFSLKKV